MKFDIYKIIQLGFYALIFIANIAIVLYMRWNKSETENLRKEMQLLHADNQKEIEILENKIKNEISSRKDGCNRHEKLNDILFSKFERFSEATNDKLIDLLKNISETLKSSIQTRG